MTKRYALNKNKFLSEAEQTALIDALDRNPGRDALMIRLALATGARPTELINIKRRDVHFESQTVLIRGIKGSDDREIPIAQVLFSQLVDYLKSHPEASSEIFRIKYSRLKQIWDMYRPAKKGFHSLRHTFAINLYRKTKDLRLLKVALGHRNIANTMIYAEYQYSSEELRRLIL